MNCVSCTRYWRVLQGTAVLGFAYVARHQRELHAGIGIGMEPIEEQMVWL